MDNERQQRYFDLGQNYFWLRGKYDFVRNFLVWYAKALPRDARVLDLGCGPGNMLNTLEEFGTVYGTDLSLEALRFGRGRGWRRLFIANPTAFPSAAPTFDLVVMIDVLEHIPDDRAALGELHRILKPGAVAVITVPAFQFLWGAHDVIYGHFRRYTRRGLANQLQTSGFEVLTSTYFETIFVLPMLAFRKIRGVFKATRDKDDFVPVPPMINAILQRVIGWESHIVRWLKPPFGVSLIAVVRKKKDIA